jgi:hypothetical protein
MAVEVHDDVPDEQARGRRRTSARDADDEQGVVTSVAALLSVRQAYRLPGQTEVSPLQPAVLEHRSRRLPRDRCGDHHAETANRGGGRDPDHAARGIEQRAAGEAVVHRRRRADHFVDRPPAPGRQRTADHRHDAGARRERIAPGARDRQREMADAGRRRGDRCRR